MVSWLTLISICRSVSQQSLSPSHHFLHSNAFSHLYKIPPSATRRGCARLVDLHFVISARFFCLSGAEMHDRCGVLHALICTFYHQEPAETIKMDVSGDFFPLRCIDLPLCFQQEAVRLCGGSVVWKGKVNAFFFSVTTLQTHSILSRHRGTWRE